MEDPLEFIDERFAVDEPTEGPEKRGLMDLLYPVPEPRNTWGIAKWWESLWIF